MMKFFRKCLTCFLILQHIFIYTLEGHRESVCVEIRNQEGKGQSVRIKFSRSGEEGQRILRWEQEFRTEGERFLKEDMKHLRWGDHFSLKESSGNKSNLLFEKKGVLGSYQFEITPQGDVKLLSLQHTTPLEIKTGGRFSTLGSTAEAEDFSVETSSIYLNSKMNVKRLKLRIAGCKEGETVTSPIVNGASSLLKIGELLRIEQEANDDLDKTYIKSLFENQGKILNWGRDEESDGYILDLADNDLIQKVISKEEGGKSSTEISAMGHLVLKGIRKLVNQGRIESGIQSFKNGSQTGKHQQIKFIKKNQEDESQLSLEVKELVNQKGGSVASARTTIIAEHFQNEGEIDGFNRLDLELRGETPSLNSGSLYGEEFFQIKLKGHLTNEGRMLSRGQVTLENLEVENSPSFKNRGIVSGRRGLFLRDLDRVDQTGSLMVAESGVLKIHARELIQDQPYSRKTERGLIRSQGSLEIRSGNIFNRGRIVSREPAFLEFGELYNQDDGFIECFKSVIFAGEKFENHSIVKGYETLQLSVKDLNNAGSLLGETVNVDNNATFTNTRKIKSQKSMRVESSHGENEGFIHAGEQFFWKGKTFKNESQLDALAAALNGETFENKKDVQVKNHLTMNLKDLHNEAGANLHAGQITVKNLQRLTNSGQIESDGFVKGKIEELHNSKIITAEGETNLTGTHFINTGEMNFSDYLDLKFSESLRNQGEMIATKDANLESGFIEQPDVNSKISSSEKLTLTTGRFENQGLLGSSDELSLKIIKGTDEATSWNKGVLQSGQHLRIESDKELRHEKTGQIIGSSIFIKGIGKFVNASVVESHSELKIEIAEFENQEILRVPGAFKFTGKTFENSAFMDVAGETIFENLKSFENTKEGHLIVQKSLTFLNGDLFQNEGTIKSTQDTTLKTLNMHNTGQLTSQGKTNLRVTEQLQNEGTLVSHDEMNVHSKDLVNTKNIIAKKTFFSEGETLFNQGADSKIETENAFTFQMTQWFRNEGSILGQRTGLIESPDFENSNSLMSLGRMNIDVGRFNNTRVISSIQDEVSLKLKTGTQAGTLLSKESMNIDVEDHLSVKSVNGERKADIESQKDLRVFGKGRLENQGNIFSTKSLSLELDVENLKNINSGEIILAGTLERLISFENSEKSFLVSTGDITAFNLLNLKNLGTLQGQKNISLQAKKIDNEGTLFGKKKIEIESDTFENLTPEAKVSTKGALSLKSSDSVFNKGFIYSLGNGDIETKTLENTGIVSSDQQLKLSIGSIKNESQLIGLSDLDVESETFENRTQKSTIATDGKLSLKSRDSIINEGLIRSLGNGVLVTKELKNVQEIGTGKSLSLRAGTLRNTGKLMGETNLDIEGEMLENQGQTAVIATQGDLGIKSKDSIFNEGLIGSRGNGILTTKALNNDREIMSDQKLTLWTEGLKNAGQLMGILGLEVESRTFENLGADSATLTQGELVVKSRDSIFNEGFIQSLGNGTIETKALENHEGKIVIDKSLILNTKTIQNRGQVVGKTKFEIASETFENSQQNAQVVTGGELSIKSRDAIFNKGFIESAGNGMIETKEFQNQGKLSSAQSFKLFIMHLKNEGEIAVQTKTEVTGETFENLGRDGRIFTTNGDLSLQSKTAIFNEGFIQSAGNGILETKTLSNRGEVSSDRKLTLKTGEVNNEGQFIGKTEFESEGETFRNVGVTSKILTAGDLNFKSQFSILNEGKIKTQGKALISTKRLSQKGWMSSGKLFEIDTQTFENEGSIRSHGDSMAVKLKSGEQRGGMTALKRIVIEIQDLFTIQKSQRQDQISLFAKEALQIIGAGALKNEGNIVSEGDVSLEIPLENSGEVQGKKLEMISLKSLSLINESTGNLTGSEGVFFKHLASLLNRGRIMTRTRFDIESGDFKNEGTLTSENVSSQTVSSRIVIETGNNGGVIESAATLQLNVGKRFANERQIQTRDVLEVIGTNSDAVFMNKTNQSMLMGEKGVEFSVLGMKSHLGVQNADSQAAISSPNSITFLQGVDLENHGKIQSGKTVSVNQPVLTNGGEIEAQRIAFNPVTTLKNEKAGILKSGSEIVFEKLESFMNEGVLQQAASLIFKGLKTFLSKGKIISEGGTIELDLNEDAVHDGILLGNRGVTVQGRRFENNGQIQSKEGVIRINGNPLYNRGQMGGESVALKSGSSLENTGSIRGTQTIDLEADSFALKDTKVVEGIESKHINVVSRASNLTLPIEGLNPLERLTLKAPSVSITNLPQINYFLEIDGNAQLKGALIFSKGIAFKIPDHFTNVYGIWGAGSLKLQIGGDFINDADCYSSKESLAVRAKSLTNKALLYGHQDSTIELTQGLVNTKTIGSGGDLNISGQSIQNQKGAYLDALGNLWIKVGGQLINTVGSLIAGGKMLLWGNALINQRDGYHFEKTRWDDSVHLEEEVPNSQQGAMIQSKGEMTLEFGTILNAASTIAATQGNIVINFKGSLDNQSKVLKKTQSSKKWVVVGHHKKKHFGKKSSWYPDYGWQWSGDAIAQGFLPALISGAGDVILKGKGGEGILATSVPVLWEKCRERILANSVLSSPYRGVNWKAHVWRQVERSGVVQMSTVGAKLKPNTVTFANPTSWVSNPNETATIGIQYVPQTVQYNGGLLKKHMKTLTVDHENIVINNPRAYMLNLFLPGLSNTGTISGKTVQAAVGKLIHGLKDIGLVDLKSRVVIPVIEIVKYMSGVGEGHYWREDKSQTKPFMINALIEPDTEVLVERSNRSFFMRGEDILSGMRELGLRPPSSTRLGQNTLVLSNPFWGGQVGHLLYDGDLPRIEPRDFNMTPKRIAVVDDPRMTPETRLFMPPQLEATLLQRALLQELKMPSLYANITNEMHQHKILRESGVRQARALKGLPALEEERDVLKQNDIGQDISEGYIGRSHREIIASDLLPQFQEPALMYRLMEYANEWVLGASLHLGSEIARAVFQENQGQILGNHIALNSHDFEIRQDMTGGEIDLEVQGSGWIEGAKIEAKTGNLSIKAKTLTLPTRKSMIHKGTGANYHHQERHERTELIASERVELEVGETLKMASTHIKGGQGVIIDAGSLEQQDESNITIDHSEIHTKKKKTFGSKKTSTITHNEVHQVVRTLLEGGEGGVEIHVEKAGILQAPIVSGVNGLKLIEKNPQARFVILTSQDIDQKSQNQTKKGKFWQSAKREGHVHTHVFMLESEGGLKGDLSHLTVQIAQKNKSFERTLDELGKDPKTAWVSDLRQEKGVNWETVEEVHQSWKKKQSGLTPAASVLCALAMGAMLTTTGLSAGIMGAFQNATLGAMTLGAVETMATQVTTAAINNKGRPDRILKTLGEKDSLKALGIAVATAGTVSELKGTFGVNVSSSALNNMSSGEHLTHYFKKSVLHTGVSSAVSVIFNETSVKEALKSVAWRIPVDTLGGLGAKTIGGYRENLGYVMHKLAHAALGGAIGFMLSHGDLSGATVGAISGASSEIIGELLTQDVTQSAFNEEWDAADRDKRPFEVDRYLGLLEGKLETLKDWTKVGSAFGALLAHQDVKIAADVTENALSNNLAPLAIAGAAASLSWNVYSLTHEEEIQAIKEEIASHIAKKLDVEPLYVEQTLDALLLVGSIGKIVIKGSKETLLKAGGTLLKESGLLKKLDINGFKKPDSSLLPTQQSKDLRRYLIVLEEESKLKIPAPQRKKLAGYTRKNNLSELDDITYKSHQELYTKPLSDKLKRQWEQETGQVWPTYRGPKAPKGQHTQGHDFDSHHIIPQKNGGPHEWWNIHPVRPIIHQHSTHGSGSTLTTLQKKYSVKPSENIKLLKEPHSEVNVSTKLEEFSGQFVKEFARDSKAYLKELGTQSGMTIPKTQRNHIFNHARDTKIVKMEKEAYDAHQKKYEQLKETMKRGWEKNTGQKWPQYGKWNEDKKIWQKVDVDLHHIIPQRYGGPHEWWNAHPMHPGNHTGKGGIHPDSSSILNKILKGVDEL